MLTSHLLSILAAAAPAATAPSTFTRLEPCGHPVAEISVPCVERFRYSAKASQRLIGRKDEVWWMDGDTLTMIARPKQSWIALCCGIQTPLDPVGTDGLASITVRIPRAKEAVFDVGTAGPGGAKTLAIFRGPASPSAPKLSRPLRGTIAPLAIKSRALGEVRRGSVYVPPGIPPQARLPVIYLADGATSNFAPILESAIREGRAAPAIIVGIDSAQGTVDGCIDKCDRRGLEYLVDWNHTETMGSSPFGRHLRFVVDELVPYIEAHYPASPNRQDRVTAGYSNGAAWALAAAEARPDLFGKVLAMSSGSKAVGDYGYRLKDSRVFAGAGILEGGTMHQRTREVAEAAKRAGADVRFRELVAGHSFLLWDILFAEGVSWLLPPPLRSKITHPEARAGKP